MALDLTGRSALVTGGAGGIGRACALRLAASGADVVVVDRSPDAAEATAKDCGGRVLVVDMADPDALDTAAAVLFVVGVLPLLFVRVKGYRSRTG